ncbi:MAG: N-acetylglucosamine-6-phosphate deacetylase [Candidatus Omnitrophica bacterium]|nr:N-acetylglucosamine-6-phosphate deacetylase [Candidatus Omnitrophota bacterium]
MHRILLKGDVLSPEGILYNHFLFCENGVIEEISSKYPRAKKKAKFFDTKKFFILPGFIDLHLHGDPILSAKYFSRFGTTVFLSTLPSIRKDSLIKRINAIKNLSLENKLPSRILGIHLEGPYINRKMAGAQNKRFIKEIDLKEVKLLIKKSEGLIRIVSLAPELDNSSALIRLLVKNNIVPAFAHTDATLKQSIRAINQGMIFSTHTFNRMGILHHRAPGVLGAVLSDDRVFCEIILDGLHINPVLFKILLRCKGVDKIILSTDSIRFEDSIRASQKRDLARCGVYRLENGEIAGSNLTMIEAITNAIKYGNLSLKDAVSLATINPARLLGIDNKKGSLETGKDADMVIADKDLNVVMTICEGRITYMRNDK